MYLHEDKEEFLPAINETSVRSDRPPDTIEKDYYVTMILKELSERRPFVVFKGGTSLSKGHRVIQRFSEDIDITTDTDVSRNKRKKLKESIKETAEILGLEITNLEKTRSKNDYNQYLLRYDSVVNKSTGAVSTYVKLETSFAEVSFPTVMLPIQS